MKRLALAGLVVAAVGGVLFAVQASHDGTRSLFTYTAAFAFVVSLSLGALLIVQISHAAHMVWIIPLRRMFEAVASIVPFYLILFIPIFLGKKALYPWAHVDRVTPTLRPLVAGVGAWMNGPLFIARGYLYLVLWSLFALLLYRASTAQDATGQDALTERQRMMSAGFFPPLALTLTFAAFDWFMSLVPACASDMYGVYFFAGSLLGALALGSILVWGALRAHILPPAVGRSHVSGIGRLLFMSVILWTYIAVATLILIWIADLPHEVLFFKQRVAAGWAWVSGLLVFGHFIAPFFILLFYDLKRRAGKLAVMGCWLLLMHAVDMYWLVVPASGEPPRALDVGAFLLLGGLACAAAALLFSRAAPYPVKDPNLSRALRYESE